MFKHVSFLSNFVTSNGKIKDLHSNKFRLQKSGSQRNNVIYYYILGKTNESCSVKNVTLSFIKICDVEQRKSRLKDLFLLSKVDFINCGKNKIGEIVNDFFFIYNFWYISY